LGMFRRVVCIEEGMRLHRTEAGGFEWSDKTRIGGYVRAWWKTEWINTCILCWPWLLRDWVVASSN